jgi:hypothetical protein
MSKGPTLMVAGYNDNAPMAIVEFTGSIRRGVFTGHFDMPGEAQQANDLHAWLDKWRENRRGMPWVTIDTPIDRRRYQGVALTFDGRSGFNFETQVMGTIP